MMRVSDIAALAVDGAGRLFIAASGQLGVVLDGVVVEIDGAPHGLMFTHAERLNAEIAAFVRS